MNHRHHLNRSLAIAVASMLAPACAQPALRIQPRPPMSRGGLSYQVWTRDAEGRETAPPMLAHNLIPTEGLNHMLDVVLHGAEAIPTWYIALFEGNFTPTFDLTGANWVQSAQECSAYQGSARLEFKETAASAGGMTNAASLSVFTMTADKTVYGAALISQSAKGSQGGKLLSIARFPQPRVLTSGSQLAILATPQLVSD